MKMHISIDDTLGLIHSLETTAATCTEMSGPNQLHIPGQQCFQFLRRIRLGYMREQVVDVG